METKKNNSLIIVIVLMALIIVGLVSYIALDKAKQEPTKEEQKQENNQEEKKEETKSEENQPLNLKIDKYEFEEYKVISETQSLMGKQHEFKIVVYKTKSTITNDMGTFSPYAERVLLDGKEIVPLSMIELYETNEENTSELEEKIIENAKSNYAMHGLEDSSGNLYYVVVYGNINSLDEELLHQGDFKETLKVLKEDFTEIYNMKKNVGRPYVWLNFENRDSAGDRNVTCNENGCHIYQYNNRGFGGGIDYDIHEGFFYTFEEFKITDENDDCNEVVTAKEYKVTVNDGKVNKELVKSYDSSKDKELDYEHAC